MKLHEGFRLACLAAKIATGLVACKPPTSSTVQDIATVDRYKTGFFLPSVDSRAKASNALGVERLAASLGGFPESADNRYGEAMDVDGGRLLFVQRKGAPAAPVAALGFDGQPYTYSVKYLPLQGRPSAAETNLYLRHRWGTEAYPTVSADGRNANIYLARRPQASNHMRDVVLINWVDHLVGPGGRLLYRMGDTIYSAASDKPVCAYNVHASSGAVRLWDLSCIDGSALIGHGSVVWTSDDQVFHSYSPVSRKFHRWHRQDHDSMDLDGEAAVVQSTLPQAVRDAIKVSESRLDSRHAPRGYDWENPPAGVPRLSSVGATGVGAGLNLAGPSLQGRPSPRPGLPTYDPAAGLSGRYVENRLYNVKVGDKWYVGSLGNSRIDRSEDFFWSGKWDYRTREMQIVQEDASGKFIGTDQVLLQKGTYKSGDPNRAGEDIDFAFRTTAEMRTRQQAGAAAAQARVDDLLEQSAVARGTADRVGQYADKQQEKLEQYNAAEHPEQLIAYAGKEAVGYGAKKVLPGGDSFLDKTTNGLMKEGLKTAVELPVDVASGFAEGDAGTAIVNDSLRTIGTSTADGLTKGLPIPTVKSDDLVDVFGNVTDRLSADTSTTEGLAQADASSYILKYNGVEAAGGWVSNAIGKAQSQPGVDPVSYAGLSAVKYGTQATTEAVPAIWASYDQAQLNTQSDIKLDEASGLLNEYGSHAEQRLDAMDAQVGQEFVESTGE